MKQKVTYTFDKRDLVALARQRAFNENRYQKPSCMVDDITLTEDGGCIIVIHEEAR